MFNPSTAQNQLSSIEFPAGEAGSVHTSARRRSLLEAIRKRWQRARRRRKVGRAYDMALEVARLLPRQSRVLDVGCGNGYIAHHLSGLLGERVIGIDIDDNTQASIDYKTFDGENIPMADRSIDAVLLCYVLHHAQQPDGLLRELHRVLERNGLAVVYEDIPRLWWDRAVCWTHNLKWRKRSGPCTFHSAPEWRSIFNATGFEVLLERKLSRWRNLSHPVSRRLYFLRATYRGTSRDFIDDQRVKSAR
jgi:SAM-dependent methyltransferase